MMQLLLAVILSNLSKITQLETFNSITEYKAEVDKDADELREEERRRQSDLRKIPLKEDGTPNHFKLLMLALQEKKA